MINKEDLSNQIKSLIEAEITVNVLNARRRALKTDEPIYSPKVMEALKLISNDVSEEFEAALSSFSRDVLDSLGSKTVLSQAIISLYRPEMAKEAKGSEELKPALTMRVANTLLPHIDENEIDQLDPWVSAGLKQVKELLIINGVTS